MADWLHFMAEIARAQHVAASRPIPVAAPEQTSIDQAVAARMPPIAADGHPRDAAWRSGLAHMLESFDRRLAPAPAVAVMADLRDRDGDALEALADDFLRGNIGSGTAGAALYVAAALQVYFTRLAATLDPEDLRLLPQRGLCPVCGSTPVSGVVTASGQTPGARYLQCSLCSTAWNHVRAVCVTCGGSRSLSLRAIDGQSGLVRAETCDECHTYTKVLYQAEDVEVDPYADDLATLGLDLLVAEAGWARHAPNPLLLVG
jgi:FdhE protein